MNVQFGHVGLETFHQHGLGRVVIEPREKQVRMGRHAGQGWIADDFDETPDCFADYM